jgi:radical SAM protein with 4Fe4S-binding SPASM domain
MKAKCGNLINQNRNKLEEVIPLSTPYSINIDPSNLCNFKCNFCAMQTSNKSVKYKKQIMSMELFKKVIDDICKFPNKLKMLRISGQGEPLINQHISEMISYAKQKDIAEYIEIVTNGSLLSPKLNRSLVKSGLDRIRISVEALSEEGYKEIAGVKINFSKFIENIKDLYDNKGNCEIYIKTVDVAVTTEESKKKFYEIFGDICDKIFIDNVIPLWSDFEEMKIDKKLLKSCEGLHGQKIKPVSVCPYIFYSFIVNPDGQITSCCADWQRKLILGDASVEAITDIWNGNVIKEFWIDMLKGNKDKYEMCSKCVLPSVDCIDNIDEYAGDILKKL